MAVIKSGNDRDSSNALLEKAEELQQGGTKTTPSIRLKASRADAQVVRDRRAPSEPGRANAGVPTSEVYSEKSGACCPRVRGRHGYAILHRARDHGEQTGVKGNVDVSCKFDLTSNVVARLWPVRSILF